MAHHPAFDLSNSPAAMAKELRGNERQKPSRQREVRVLPRPGTQSYRGLLRDFTRKSIGIVVNQGFVVDTILAIQLRSASTGLSCMLSGRVIHATVEADGHWLIGCTLSRPLSDEEALALL